MITRPMLAASAKRIEDIKLPCFVQVKKDGIRAIKTPKGMVSRTFKLLPNRYIQETLNQFVQGLQIVHDGFDGELVTLDPLAIEKKYNDIQSDVMSRDGVPDFKYIVFDWLLERIPYFTRQACLQDWATNNQHLMPRYIELLPSRFVESHEQLQLLYEEALRNGDEGLICRGPSGFYKAGRSTLTEQALVKLKPMEDSEAVALEFHELMHNTNEQEMDNFGLTKRSSHDAFKIGGNVLGSITVMDVESKVTFEIGSGFTAYQRHEIWRNRNLYLHKVLTYKYQKFGSKDKPRCPVFKGWRFD